MEIPILYEDADIVAINKPAGLVVHSDGKTDEPTLVDWILEKYPKTKGVGEPGRTPTGQEIDRPGIVHRIDRETSGVLLIAKTTQGFDCLKQQFQNHLIRKEYHAFVYGEMKQDEGTIDRPIGRSPKDFRRWSAQPGARGAMRDAITEYTVVARGKGYTLVHVSPRTGRTHQIRVHFKAIHYSLVADSLYGPEKENMLGFNRLALHAFSITFNDCAGHTQTVTASYPPDFAHAVALLQS